MTTKLQSPSELRNVLGKNLQHLIQGHRSVSEISRKLGINRTQFNRYLNGESYPRPDVLERICKYFQVDARIMLEPIAQINFSADVLSHEFLRHHIGTGVQNIPQDLFPSGFYQFTRKSYLKPDRYVTGLVYVKRQHNATYIRGYYPKTLMQAQGLETGGPAREFRGLVFRQEEGVSIMTARKGMKTTTYQYLHRTASFENNFWFGYIAHAFRGGAQHDQVGHLVFEHLGTDVLKIKTRAKKSGFCDFEELSPYTQTLLQGDPAFRAPLIV